MTGRRLTTALTMVGLVAIVCLMAVWGIHAATAPIKDSGSSSSSNEPTCAPEDQTVQEFVRRGQVTVSVYNTGKRAGRAGKTLDLLENAGFEAGAIGNADADDNVPRAEVRTTKQNDKAAQLVALALGKNTRVVVVTDDYGPGVDVFIGDRFGGLDPKAPRRVALTEPRTTCK
ncbi:LytR C-terminal domain-containing protein [Marmoricola sp. RAF53]|uniref:LytR C-terminal domain-containing protein n=1 Tax=Marmoricola sp. RAF53 TaxID=3233059 RepID=UPI003F94DFBF